MEVEQRKWKKRVTAIDRVNRRNSHIISLDETGSVSYLKTILKKDLQEYELDPLRRYFTLTACVFTRENYRISRKEFEKIKMKYWPLGMHIYNDGAKEVCFHSYEIRRDKGAFSKVHLKNKSLFLTDLTSSIHGMNFKIASVTIDLYKYSKSIHNQSVYTFALCNILERVVYNEKSLRNSLVVLESRGPKEDQELHKEIVDIFDNNGLWKIGSNELDRKFEGIYFNGKWKGITAHFGLELSDLLCYPINKYQSTNVKDPAFSSFEQKFYGYPDRIKFGLMKF